MRKKTHLTDSYERSNESNTTEFWGDPICKTEAEEPELTIYDDEVTCKRCLKLVKGFRESEKENAKNF